MTIIRLLVSGLVAFLFYAAWSWYANSLVTSDQEILLKAALVQGFYSGGITLFFTFLLERFYKIFGASVYCLALVTPRWSTDSKDHQCSTKLNFDKAIQVSEKMCKGACVPGMLLAPLPAIILQSVMVVSVNVLFETPNLWPTVLPSILFSAIYGYIYSIGLAKTQARSSVTNS